MIRNIGFFYTICVFAITACHNNSMLQDMDIQVLKCSNSTSEALETPPPYNVTNIIKLETKVESFITNIKQMEMNDSLIFILDGSGSLLVFNHSGEFNNRIGEKGEAPCEYLELSTFYVNVAKKTVTLIDSYKNMLLNYTFDGKYISSIIMPQDALSNCNNSILISDNTLLLFSMIGTKESTAYSLIDVGKKELVGKYFPYAPIKTNNYFYSFSKHPIAKIGDGADVILPLCDTVYNYLSTSHTFEPKYKVEIPRKMASKYQIRNDSKQTYSAQLYDLWAEGYFTGFNGIYETKEKIVLTYLSGITMGYLVFDKLNQEGNNYIYTYSDAPKVIPFFPIIYAYDNKFISSVKAEELLNCKSSIKDEIFQEAIKDLREDDNPCLLIYELE